MVTLSVNGVECRYGSIKVLSDVNLEVQPGDFVGILGPNGIGKTTFINLISEKINIENRKIPEDDPNALKKIKVSIKPQYIKMDDKLQVSNIINKIKLSPHFSQIYKKRVLTSLSLDSLNERLIGELSGGELQRVAIADCLSNNADLYFLDEPSAFLDVEMRLQLAQLLRKCIEEIKKAAFVVEHDIITQDFIADSILVFDGTPGIEGKAFAPQNLRDGFNKFLKIMDLTFRRDSVTNRPRVNKPGSNKDEYQKRINEYYYVPE